MRHPRPLAEFPEDLCLLTALPLVSTPVGPLGQPGRMLRSTPLGASACGFPTCSRSSRRTPVCRRFCHAPRLPGRIGLQQTRLLAELPEDLCLRTVLPLACVPWYFGQQPGGQLAPRRIGHRPLAASPCRNISVTHRRLLTRTPEGFLVCCRFCPLPPLPLCSTTAGRRASSAMWLRPFRPLFLRPEGIGLSLWPVRLRRRLRHCHRQMLARPRRVTARRQSSRSPALPKKYRFATPSTPRLGWRPP